MKFAALTSIGHNIADSLASGNGLLIGVYDMDVFGEADQGPDGYILVDFLAGTSSGNPTSEELARAIGAYAEVLPGFCRKHGVEASEFRELTARYAVDSLGRRYIVTVENKRGRRSVDEYVGVPGRRAKELDELGRVRPKRLRGE